MSDIIIVSLVYGLPAFFVLIRNLLWDLYFWEIKEYRLDRVSTHVLWDQDEKNRRLENTLLKYIALALLTLVFITPFFALMGLFLAFFIWFTEFSDAIYRFRRGTLKKFSVKSPRNILVAGIFITLISVIFIGLVFPFADLRNEAGDEQTTFGIIAEDLFTNADAGTTDTFPDVYILLTFLAIIGLLLDIASPIIIGVLVWLTSPIAIIRRMLKIRQAKQYHQQVKHNLEIIGITGSQGKTTTKELIYEVLRDSFKVAKTPENNNTDFGIARAFLSNVKKDTNIFIAEMGAYRIGEIKKMAEAFPPTTSIVTAMDTQHIGLFGSQENLYKAKSEIVMHMAEGGTAIVNGDNPGCRAVTKKFDGELHFFTTQHATAQAFFKAHNISDNSKISVHIAKEVKIQGHGLSFTYVHGDVSQKITLDNAPKHLVSNILIAVIVAHQNDVPLEEIAKRLKDMDLSLPRLQIDTGDNYTLVINDSYSSSEKGFLAAVEFMHDVDFKNLPDLKDTVKGRNIIITKGIFELGSSKSMIYKRMVKQIADKVDLVFSTDPVLRKYFKLHGVEVKSFTDYKDLLYQYRGISRPGDVVLLEGKLHPAVIKELISDKN